MRLPQGRWTVIAAILAAVMTGLTLHATPASADYDDEEICGKWVRGEILNKYRSMGGWNSPLRCPTTDELRTPNGKGAYNHFEGGSIYWSPATGAHPVWGAVRDKWGSLDWENGQLGFPRNDEFTNPDGEGKRQEFEGGTIYWHPTKSRGAHPVGGAIGGLWGQYGWEGGHFGYPITDEIRDQYSEGGVRQLFSTNNTQLVWTPRGDVAGGHPCASECVSYQAPGMTKWVKWTKVYRFTGNGAVIVQVTPTAEGRADSSDDYEDLWRQSFDKVPLEKNMSVAQNSSLKKQLACHAKWAINKPGGGNFGGPTWDLESWRYDYSWGYALDAVNVLPPAGHKCNWDPQNP